VVGAMIRKRAEEAAEKKDDVTNFSGDDQRDNLSSEDRNKVK